MINATNVANLQLKYHLDVPSSYVEPVIANGRIYTASCPTGTCSDGHDVSGYSLADGSSLGVVHTMGEHMSFAYGSLFTIRHSGDYTHGWLTRTRPDLNRTLWTAQSHMYNDGEDGLTGVLAAGGFVYAKWSGAIRAYSGYSRGADGVSFLLADAGDGPILGFELASIAYAYERLYATEGSTLYVFEPGKAIGERCRPVATKTVPGAMLRWIAVASGVVVVTNANTELIAFDAETLDEKWRVPSPTQLYGIPVAISGGRVFVSENVGNNGRMRALSLRTGALLWQTAQLPKLSSPSVGGDVVYATGGQTLYAYATSCGTGGATCTPLLSIAHAGHSPPIIAAGHIVVAHEGLSVFSLP